MKVEAEDARTHNMVIEELKTNNKNELVEDDVPLHFKTKHWMRLMPKLLVKNQV